MEKYENMFPDPSDDEISIRHHLASSNEKSTPKKKINVPQLKGKKRGKPKKIPKSSPTETNIKKTDPFQHEENLLEKSFGENIKFIKQNSIKRYAYLQQFVQDQVDLLKIQNK